MRALLVWMTAAIFFCASAADNWAADPEVKFNLLTLPNVRVAAEQLDAPARIFGERITLRASVAQLAEVYQFSYWIDRQVDADQPVSLTLQEATLGECLRRLAEGCHAEVGLVENVVTIAAPPRLASLQYTAVRLHDHLSRTLPTASNRKGTGAAELRPLAWPMLTTPTELYRQIGKTWGFRTSVELPHDLMNAGQLYPCTAATQLTLLLGGFDRCAVGQQLGELRIVPLPKASPWQAVYADLPEANIAAVTAEFPEAKLSRTGKQLVFSGTTAAHLRLLHRSSPRSSAPSAIAGHSPSQRHNGTRQPGQRSGQPQEVKSPEDALAKQRYTIKLDQSQALGSVLTALASQLGLQVEWSETLAPVDSQRTVTLDVKDARLDEVLERLAGQAGVSIARRGLVIEVAPRVAAPTQKDQASPDR